MSGLGDHIGASETVGRGMEAKESVMIGSRRLNPVRSVSVQGRVKRIPLPSFLALTLLLLCLQPAQAQQGKVNAAVHLKNGLIQSVTIHSANDNGIQWTGRNTPNPKLLPHSEIARIDFPEPDLWKQANTFLCAGDYTKAIAAYSSLAKNPRGNFYPAPGNYTSRARLRLIECYRETGNTKGIAEVAATLKANSLPHSLRAQMEVVSCWAELSRGNWDAAITQAEALAANPILPGREDLGFIKAVALENTGRTQEAITAYGTAYTADFGASRELAKRAMKSAILLLVAANDEGREGELNALVHTYAKVYNEGELWEGAPAKAVGLLSKELELSGMVEASTEEENSGKTETTEPSEAGPKLEDNAQPKPAAEEAGKSTDSKEVPDEHVQSSGQFPHPQGKVVGPLTAGESSYFLYLPESLVKDRLAPLLFFTGAQGGGARSVNKHIEGAEVNGWIVAASVESKNGVNGSPHVRACLEDIKRTLPVDPERFYYTGHSGGGQRALVNLVEFGGAGAIPIIAHGVMSEYPSGKHSYYFLGGAADYNRYGTAALRKKYGSNAVHRLYPKAHADSPPEMSCDGMAWLNGRFLADQRSDRDFQEECMDYELSMLSWINGMKKSNPKRAMYLLDFLLEDYDLKGKNRTAAEGVLKELSADSANARYVQGLKDLDELSEDLLSALGVGSRHKQETAEVSRKAQALLKEYKDIPEFEAILEMLKGPTQKK